MLDLLSGHTGWSYAPEVHGLTIGVEGIAEALLQPWVGREEDENMSRSADVGNDWEY
jgi:hypothetical protein